MTYAFTRTGPEIEAIHNTVTDPSTNEAFTDAIGEQIIPKYTDIVYKASGGNSAVENMIADFSANPTMRAIGTIIKTGGTTWVYEDSTGPITLDNFRAFNVACCLDWGVIPDDSDVTAKMQSMFNYLGERGGGNAWFPKTKIGRYRVTESIFLQAGINIVGDGSSVTNIFAESGGSYLQNFVFHVNTTDGETPTIPFINFKIGSFKDLSFDAGDNAIKLLNFAGGSMLVDNVVTRFFATSVRGSSAYNDHVTIRRCSFFSNVVSSSYQIELENLGDGNVIDQCQIANINNSPLTPQNSVKATGSRLKMTNCLYGNVYLINMQGSTSIENCGQDGGKYIFQNSHVSLENCGMSATPVGTFPIRLENTTQFKFKCNIENLLISHDFVRDAYDPNEYDIKTAFGYILDIKNVTRNLKNSLDPSARSQMGIKLEKDNGSPFDEFNNLSHYYSTRCTIASEFITNGLVSIELPQISLGYFSSLGPFAVASWKEATGTYYYRINVLWDSERGVSRTDTFGERSISLTNGGDAASLVVGASGYPPTLTARVYRGSSSGSYDKYVDIPVVDALSFIDNGGYIAGLPWISRAAGPVTPVNLFNIGGYANSMGKSKMRATAIPTAGSWLQGDVIENTNVSAGGNFGWVCVSSGSPGTWKEFGSVEV